MKQISILLFSALMSLSAFSQEQDTLRLFGNNQKEKAPKETQKDNFFNSDSGNGIRTITGPGHKLGFYFGFNTSYSQIDGYDAFSAGASVAMISNHGLALGFAGKGFFSEVYKTEPGSNTSYGYAGGYGGFLIEPILFPKNPVHVSFPVLLGAGGIAQSRLVDYGYPYEYDDFYIDETQAYLIAEPGVELEFNIAKWIRLGLGASYRITTSLGPDNFSNDALKGFTGGLSMKFGLF